MTTLVLSFLSLEHNPPPRAPWRPLRSPTLDVLLFASQRRNAPGKMIEVRIAIHEVWIYNGAPPCVQSHLNIDEDILLIKPFLFDFYCCNRQNWIISLVVLISFSGIWWRRWWWFVWFQFQYYCWNNICHLNSRSFAVNFISNYKTLILVIIGRRKYELNYTQAY